MGRELSDDIADDIGEIFTDVNDFGQVVTHTRRHAAAVTIAGTVAWTAGTPANDDRMNRNSTHDATIVIGLLDTDGNSYTLDEDGTFTIGSIAYRITQVQPMPGGYTIKLTRVNRKTLNSHRTT